MEEFKRGIRERISNQQYEIKREVEKTIADFTTEQKKKTQEEKQAEIAKKLKEEEWRKRFEEERDEMIKRNEAEL